LPVVIIFIVLGLLLIGLIIVIILLAIGIGQHSDVSYFLMIYKS